MNRRIQRSSVSTVSVVISCAQESHAGTSHCLGCFALRLSAVINYQDAECMQNASKCLAEGRWRPQIYDCKKSVTCWKSFIHLHPNSPPASYPSWAGTTRHANWQFPHSNWMASLHDTKSAPNDLGTKTPQSLTFVQQSLHVCSLKVFYNILKYPRAWLAWVL